MGSESQPPKHRDDGPRLAREHFAELLSDREGEKIVRRGQLLYNGYSAQVFNAPPRSRGTKRGSERYAATIRRSHVGMLAVEGWQGDESLKSIPRLRIRDIMYIPKNHTNGISALVRQTSALFIIKSHMGERGYPMEAGLRFNFLEKSQPNDFFSDLAPHTRAPLKSGLHQTPQEFLAEQGFLFDSDWDLQAHILDIADLCISLAKQAPSA